MIVWPKFLQRINESAHYYLSEPNDKYNILFSGGKDSLALLIWTIKRFGANKVRAVHINHRFIEWDDFCANQCQNIAKDLNVEFLSLSPNQSYVNSEGLGSKESFCRKIRLSLIEKNFTKSLFFAAHHLDDAVESFIMKAMQGQCNELPIPFRLMVGTNAIYRPMLIYEVDNILHYLKNSGFDTNRILIDPLNDTSQRGWIRKTLMPVLGEKYPGLQKIVRKKYVDYYS